MKTKLLAMALFSLTLSSAGTLALAEMSTASAGPSDAQIAAIAVAANDVDIDSARLAISKTKNSEVKNLAEGMLKDHMASNKSAKALCKKLGVKPEPNDSSKDLLKGGTSNIAKLKKLNGKAFDSAYAGHEVDFHQAVLDAIDHTLLPSAKNAELKSLVEQIRAVVFAHLGHAKAVQASL